MPKGRKIFSLVSLLLVACVIQILLGGHLTQVIQGTSLFGVLALTILTSIHHLGPGGTVAGLSSCLLGLKPEPSRRTSVDRFHRAAPTWAMFASTLVAVLGLIRVMSTLNDPSQIGPAVAVAFTSYIYGALLVLILGPGEIDEKRDTGPTLAAAALTPGLGLMLLFMTIMYAITQADLRAQDKRNQVPETQNKTDTG